eukprot:PhM_4_TR11221/c0_g1_i1/m.18365
MSFEPFSHQYYDEVNARFRRSSSQQHTTSVSAGRGPSQSITSPAAPPPPSSSSSTTVATPSEQQRHRIGSSPPQAAGSPTGLATNTELVRTLYCVIHPDTDPTDTDIYSSPVLLQRCVDTVRAKEKETKLRTETMMLRQWECIVDEQYWMGKTAEYALALGALKNVLGTKFLERDGWDSTLSIFESAVNLVMRGDESTCAPTLHRILESYSTNTKPHSNTPVGVLAQQVETLVRELTSLNENLVRQNDMARMALSEYESIVTSQWEGGPTAAPVLERIRRMAQGEHFIDDYAPHPPPPSYQQQPDNSIGLLLSTLPEAVAHEYDVSHEHFMRDMAHSVARLQQLVDAVQRSSTGSPERFHMFSLRDLNDAAARACSFVEQNRMALPAPVTYDSAVLPLLRTTVVPTEGVTPTFLRAALDERNSREDQLWGILRGELSLPHDARSADVVEATRDVLAVREDFDALRRGVESVIIQLPVVSANEERPTSLLEELQLRCSAIISRLNRSATSPPRHAPPLAPSRDVLTTLGDVVHWINDRFVRDALTTQTDYVAWWRDHAASLRRTTASADTATMERMYKKLLSFGQDSGEEQSPIKMPATSDLALMVEDEVDKLIAEATDCETVITHLREHLPECATLACDVLAVINDASRYDLPDDEALSVQHPLETVRGTLPKIVQKLMCTNEQLVAIENYVESVVMSMKRSLGYKTEEEQQTTSKTTRCLEAHAKRVLELSSQLVELQHESRRRQHESNPDVMSNNNSLTSMSGIRLRGEPDEYPTTANNNSSVCDATVRRLASLTSSLLQVPYFSFPLSSGGGTTNQNNTSVTTDVMDAADTAQGLQKVEAGLVRFSGQFKQGVIVLEQDVDALRVEMVNLLDTLQDEVSLKEMGLDRDMLDSIVRRLNQRMPYFHQRYDDNTTFLLKALRAVKIIFEHVVEASRLWVDRAKKAKEALTLTCERMLVGFSSTDIPAGVDTPAEVLGPYLSNKVGSQLDSMRRQRDAAESELAVLRVRQRENAGLSQAREEAENKYAELKTYCKSLREALAAKRTENRILKDARHDLETRLSNAKSMSVSKFAASPTPRSRSVGSLHGTTPLSKLQTAAVADIPLHGWIEISPSRRGCTTCDVPPPSRPPTMVSGGSGSSMPRSGSRRHASSPTPPFGRSTPRVTTLTM